MFENSTRYYWDYQQNLIISMLTHIKYFFGGYFLKIETTFSIITLTLTFSIITLTVTTTIFRANSTCITLGANQVHANLSKACYVHYTVECTYCSKMGIRGLESLKNNSPLEGSILEKALKLNIFILHENTYTFGYNQIWLIIALF